MSQIPRGDSSDYMVEYSYDASQPSTFKSYVDQLRSFIAGKLHTHVVCQCNQSAAMHISGCRVYLLNWLFICTFIASLLHSLHAS